VPFGLKHYIALACRQSYEVLLIRDDKDKLLFDVSTIPQMHLDFTKKDEAKLNLHEEIKKRLQERNFINDARIIVVSSSFTTGERRILEDIYNNGSPITWGLKDEGVVAGIVSVPRLLDKQLIQSVGKFEMGYTAYRLTPFGNVVAQIMKDKLQIFKDELHKTSNTE
jgi:hypothetical protein